MPSPENPTFNTAPVNGESAGETTRQVYEARGEKTLQTEREQHERELLEERARLEAELAATNLRITELRQQLGLPTIPEQAITTEQTVSPEQTQSPESQAAPASPEAAPTQPVPAATPAENTPSQSTANSANTESGTTPESQPTQEEINDTINKAKKNSGLKKVLIGAAAIALAGITAAGIWLGISSANKKDQSTTPERPSIVEVTESSFVGEDQESQGIYDGYGEKGMWLSQDKNGSYDFASAREVAEVCDNDECEMVKYTARNQVESYADYLANLPEELQPEGFKGLTILETEQKLESLPDEEFEAIKQQFDGIIDNAFTRRVVVNGEQNNAYMRLKDGNGSVTHGNMELVACTTNENNLEVTQLYWVDKDGKEIGSMTIKMLPVYDSEESIVGFGGCMQVISGDRRVYTGLTTITENPPTTPTTPTTPDAPTTPDNPTTPPDTPTTPPDEPTTPPDTPEETIKPKDPDNLERIDEQINEDIAEDVGTDEVHVTPNPGVSDDEITDRPSSDDYQGTSPDIVQNDDSREAEPVQDQVSPENDYSEDRGGANSGEYAPVQDDQAAQDAADASETPVNEAPTGGDELDDILGELGIN